MIVLMPSRVFSSVHVITRGRQRERERHHCQCKEEKRLDSRAAWASLGLPEKPFVGDQPSLDNCAPTVYSQLWWLPAGESQGQNLGKYLAHPDVIVSQGGGRTAGEGGPATWLMPGSGTEGQRPVLWQLMLSSGTCEQTHGGHHLALVPDQQTLPWHWGRWGLGHQLWQQHLDQHQQRAASPTLGALQTFLKVRLPSTAVTEHPKDVLHFRGISPRVTSISFFNWIKALKWHGCLKILPWIQNHIVFPKWNFCSLL